MLRPKIIDTEVEDEISKMVEGEGEILLQKPKSSTSSIKVHSVNLDSVIKYESTYKNKSIKENENGKENAEGKLDRRSTGGNGSTAVSRKKRKPWYETIW